MTLLALLGLTAGVAVSGPTVAPARDPVTWDPVAFADFMQTRAIDPDERIFLASAELQRLDRFNQLKTQKPYRFKIPRIKIKVRESFFTPTISLAASQAVNNQIVQDISSWRGLDPNFMINLAFRESSLNNLAQARTSSGAGLYQFTENTWLCALLDHGNQYQIAGVDQIYRTAKGRCVVNDFRLRAQLLALRYDSVTNAKLGADHTIDNFQILQDYLGRPPTETEVYMLHFFGETEGKPFLVACIRTPNDYAARLFPRAAASNHSLFYHNDGTPRRLYEVYDNFSRSFAARQG